MDVVIHLQHHLHFLLPQSHQIKAIPRHKKKQKNNIPIVSEKRLQQRRRGGDGGVGRADEQRNKVGNRLAERPDDVDLQHVQPRINRRINPLQNDQLSQQIIVRTPAIKPNRCRIEKSINAIRTPAGDGS